MWVLVGLVAVVVAAVVVVVALRIVGTDDTAAGSAPPAGQDSDVIDSAPAADPDGNNITTIAGTGEWGYLPRDGSPATAADLYRPVDVAVHPDGRILIAEEGNSRVRAIDTEGYITTIAGTGERGFSGDGDRATAAQLDGPAGVAVHPDGRILIVDEWNHRVRAIDADGIITTIAGSGETGLDAGGFAGDGGPATQAQLNGPTGVAVHPDGRILIVDEWNNRVRAIGTDGIITTVAGSGEWGFSGDGGPATAAGFAAPSGVAVHPDGRILIADEGNNRVRAIGIDGIITTIAGADVWGAFSGDGGPATAAEFDGPAGVAVHPDGRILVADFWNNRVRAIGTDGIITTVAGTGEEGFSGDGGAATATQLARPTGVAVHPDGRILIADAGNDRVRAIG